MESPVNAYAQLQVPGVSLEYPSVTLTIGGNTVLIQLTSTELKKCRELLNLPEEG